MAALACAIQAAGNEGPPENHARGTLENMKTAYRGERNAQAKYKAFAAKAKAEGYLGVTSLFNAAAFAESVHAAQFARAIAALGGEAKAEIRRPEVKSTEANLKDSLKGET